MCILYQKNVTIICITTVYEKRTARTVALKHFRQRGESQFPTGLVFSPQDLQKPRPNWQAAHLLLNGFLIRPIGSSIDNLVTSKPCRNAADN